MSAPRTTVDVSRLPRVPFGHHGLLWWGTLGFALIEGFTLLVTAASYFYLRLNEYDWPPGRTPDPELLIPTLNTLLILGVIVPMRAVDRAARRRDRWGVVRGLLVALAMTVVAVVLRWWDLLALGVRWDAHAYASAAWALVTLHATLLVVDVLETATLAGLFISGRAKQKHYPDAVDAADYQYFLSAVWVPVYLVVYWGPRLL